MTDIYKSSQSNVSHHGIAQMCFYIFSFFDQLLYFSVIFARKKKITFFLICYKTIHKFNLTAKYVIC